MNHIGITKELRQKEELKLRKRSSIPTYTFAIISLLPVLIYGLYAMGLFKTTWKDPLKVLEEATSLISTNSGVGTAFLVSSDKLLTARHVVEDVAIGDVVSLLFEMVEPQISTNAILEWRDDTPLPNNVDLNYFLTDVAVLRLIDPDAVMDVQPLSIGSSDDIPNLTKIIAIGYPGGDYSITEGSINSDNIEGEELFKLDAASNPGNSGGPIIAKEDHTVIGMLVGAKGGDQEGENVANKINNILSLLEKNGVVIE